MKGYKVSIFQNENSFLQKSDSAIISKNITNPNQNKQENNPTSDNEQQQQSIKKQLFSILVNRQNQEREINLKQKNKQRKVTFSIEIQNGDESENEPSLRKVQKQSIKSQDNKENQNDTYNQQSNNIVQTNQNNISRHTLTIADIVQQGINRNTQLNQSKSNILQDEKQSISHKSPASPVKKGIGLLGSMATQLFSSFNSNKN